MPQQPNLPVEVTSFVGRQREIDDILRLLESARLLTITGTAGCGKTRLALRVAAQVRPQYADGMYWIELGQLSNPDLVSQSVAKKLNVVEQQDRPLLDGILDVLAGKQLLIVLDNCEHVVEACVRLVAALLKLPGIRLLLTSRAALGVKGEARYPLSPLAFPTSEPSLQAAGQFEAIQLFVARAQAILPEFQLTPANTGTVANICRQLDGIPLAIELAGARLNTLTVAQIDARLKHIFRLLGKADPPAPAHQRTLRAALDWSYDLLTPPEQSLLRRLAIFPGGWRLEAAEAVCVSDDIEAEPLVDRLSALILKSLVVAQTLQRTEARYRLLEIIRQYAREKLSAAGEWEAMQDRLLGYSLRLAEETAPKLNGPSQQKWLDWLEGEYGNIRSALDWALEADRIEDGLRIALNLYQFWIVRDYVEEGLTWHERLLARADGRVSAEVRANALAYAAFLAGFRGNTAAQSKYAGQAQDFVARAGELDKSALRWALAALAFGALTRYDFEIQLALGLRVIQLNRELGDQNQLSVSLSIYSLSAMMLQKYEVAGRMLAESLALHRQAGNTYRIALTLNLSGDLARCQQNYPQARACYEESIAIMRQLEAVRDLASVHYNLGHTYLHLGDIQRAEALFKESIRMQQAQGNQPGVAECLIGFAALACASNQYPAAARLLAAAVAIGGQRIATTWAATQMEYEHYRVIVQAQLSEAAFQAEQANGRAFTLEQAVAYAHRFPRQAEAAEVGEKPDSLTARERQVATLIAAGKSNEEIAGELVVSKRTVEKHIANIRSKLGFAQRTQIVRWAIDSGLLSHPQ